MFSYQFYAPRLTIALKLFCSSYMESIRNISMKSGKFLEESKGDQLYNDIFQLDSVIAAVYHQYDDKLPDNQVILLHEFNIICQLP